ncbi:hypothetical protein A2154_03435 [Candidatus Gottesmanbacteria bacterium RBG_16_43_7]|uniref:UmuC domain-containing protein n=1 Tax=Candidatus Gottesmanbacteria bacterium RBG_16_43_7 TaxID=1798373 RepID=A0A1F5Z9V0_9BACT|nr:MAG: hypothetical protein A2154_03435 [Candidatus Gottesmanbacteria bacterium RBG_16_43_7]
MHIDLNSCFATVEQQANPHLRGKPVAVAAYDSPGGCILAASYEAKKFGVNTGLRVREGRALCPGLIVLSPEPNKYRFINRKLTALLSQYTAEMEVRSIDEMVLNFAHSVTLETKIKQISEIFKSNKKNCYIAKLLNCCLGVQFGLNKFSPALVTVNNSTIQQFNNSQLKVILSMFDIGLEIKNRIKSDIGDYLTVSIGISTNRFLAKTASGLRKPDGLDAIVNDNIEGILANMKVEDLCGIKGGYGARLRFHGIGSALSFYRASIRQLRGAFSSINGYYWWLRLHGWEADDRDFGRKSFGHSHALYEPYATGDRQLHQILCQLVEKMGRRLRRRGYSAGGIHLACLFDTRARPPELQSIWQTFGSGPSFWHKSEKLPFPVYAGSDLYREALRVLAKSPDLPVRILSVACFYLIKRRNEQLHLYEDHGRQKELVAATDRINDRWGELTVFPAQLLTAKRRVIDRIAFGGVKELEEISTSDFNSEKGVDK